MNGNATKIAVAVAGGGAIAAVIPWDNIFTGILGAGGVPPALFLLIVVPMGLTILVLARALSKSEEGRRLEAERYTNARVSERKECDTERNMLQEKRVEEGNKAILALERNTTALATHTMALQGRTDTLGELVQGMAGLAKYQEATRDHFERRVHDLETGIKNTLELLRK